MLSKIPSLWKPRRGCTTIRAMERTDEIARKLAAELGRPPVPNADLREYSNFRIGGPADLLIETGTRDELVRAVALAGKERIPFYVVGGGYNILFSDRGYRGLLIRNTALGLKAGPSDSSFEFLSGTPLSRLLLLAMDRGAERMEFLAGIPGTLGGALFTNAGAFGRAIGDFLIEAVLLDGAGRETRVPKEALDFSYRRSILQTRHDIVVSCLIEVPSGDPKDLKDRVRDILEKRRAKHPPWGTPCAGSYFRNPTLPDGTRTPAGCLLEGVGAREARVGGAAVYQGHCNFLINDGGASAGDVLALADLLKKRVMEKYGVALEEEVVRIEESASML